MERCEERGPGLAVSSRSPYDGGSDGSPPPSSFRANGPTAVSSHGLTPAADSFLYWFQIGGATFRFKAGAELATVKAAGEVGSIEYVEVVDGTVYASGRGRVWTVGDLPPSSQVELYLRAEALAWGVT